jgi:hypothetical protein
MAKGNSTMVAGSRADPSEPLPPITPRCKKVLVILLSGRLVPRSLKFLGTRASFLLNLGNHPEEEKRYQCKYIM